MIPWRVLSELSGGDEHWLDDGALATLNAGSIEKLIESSVAKFLHVVSDAIFLIQTNLSQWLCQ
jgi:hypothetical protein